MMPKWCHKGARNHRFFNLFEKRWLSATVNLTLVERSILRIGGPKKYENQQKQKTKIRSGFWYKNDETMYQKGPQMGSEIQKGRENSIRKSICKMNLETMQYPAPGLAWPGRTRVLTKTGGSGGPIY
jgi:hypothetical protein